MKMQIPGIPLLNFKDVLSSGYSVGEPDGYREYTPPLTYEQIEKLNKTKTNL
jgi:hypothetical protein